MKIIAGSLGGRVLAQPKTRAVRPLSDKVRAAIFDVIGPVLGFTVLDAYAGSGAAGFEALSRGALLTEGIEANGSVARTIIANERALDLGMRYILHQMTVATWLGSPLQQPPQPRYDLIIADPPYAQAEDDILDRLGRFLKPSGVLVVSHSSKRPSPMLQSCQLKVEKTYGDSALSFYQAV